MSLGEWLDEATPREARVGVCFDGQLMSRLEAAKERLADIERPTAMLGDAEKMEARAAVETLEAEVKAKTRVFTFKSIGWGRWKDLVSKHPPKAEVAEAWQTLIASQVLPGGFGDLQTDPATWIPAVLVATCDEIASTGEAMRLIKSAATVTGVMDRLWAGVEKANHGGQTDPFAGGFIDSEIALASERK